MSNHFRKSLQIEEKSLWIRQEASSSISTSYMTLIMYYIEYGYKFTALLIAWCRHEYRPYRFQAIIFIVTTHLRLIVQRLDVDQFRSVEFSSVRQWYVLLLQERWITNYSWLRSLLNLSRKPCDPIFRVQILQSSAEESFTTFRSVLCKILDLLLNYVISTTKSVIHVFFLFIEVFCR